MCRQGGYYEQAAYLATKHGEHELVVDILIEDSKRYSEALQYIWRLEPAAVSVHAQGTSRRSIKQDTNLEIGISKFDEVCEGVARTLFG